MIENENDWTKYVLHTFACALGDDLIWTNDLVFYHPIANLKHHIWLKPLVPKAYENQVQYLLVISYILKLVKQNVLSLFQASNM